MSEFLREYLKIAMIVVSIWILVLLFGVISGNIQPELTF